MSISYKLRQAVINDAPTIRSLIRQARLNPMGTDWRRFVVATTSQEGIIGCGQVKKHRDGSRELASIVVAPEWRGQGVAGEIIKHLVSIHPKPLYLMCRSDLRDFYEQFGFHAVQPNNMPSYFKRIQRLFSVFKVVSRAENELLVMKLD